MKAKLNKTSVRELSENAPAKERLIADVELPGFGLRIRAGRKPSYFFRYKRGKNVCLISIGTTDGLTPDQARTIARGIKAKRQAGLDPLVELERDRDRLTISGLADRYIEWAELHKKPGSVKYDRAMLRNHVVPAWGNRAADSVKRDDVLRLKAERARESKSSVNAVMALVSKMFNLAEDWGVRPINSNPARRIGKFKIQSRDRILTPDELARLGAALAHHEASDCPEAVTLVRALLLTGARLNEIMAAKASQLDPNRRILMLHDSKTGRGFIALSDDAFELLNGIERKGSPWLVPGPIKGKPIRHPWQPWRRILKTAGIEDMRLHDLRHVFGSYSHQFGASQRTVASLLRHRQLATTERYLQGFDSETRAAANRTAKGLSELLAGTSG